LDFFSNTGNGTSATTGNFSFLDAAAGLVGTGTVTAGSYKPTSRGTAASFFNSTSGFFTLPAGPYNRAATAGTSTFTTIYGNTNPIGTWSLYFSQNIIDPSN